MPSVWWLLHLKVAYIAYTQLLLSVSNALLLDQSRIVVWFYFHLYGFDDGRSFSSVVVDSRPSLKTNASWIFPVVISWFVSPSSQGCFYFSLQNTRYFSRVYNPLATDDNVVGRACCVRETSCRFFQCKFLSIINLLPLLNRLLINVIRLLAFSGRPMIECSECLTWIHLSCAKIRKSNVPDVFICQKCRDAKHTMRRSNRVRTQPKTKAINFKP